MFYIKSTRHFYNKPQQTTLLIDDETGAPARFRTAREAREKIAALEGRDHHLLHDEYGRPDYRVVHESRLPDYLKSV